MTALLEIREIRDLVSPVSVAEYHQRGEFNENGRRTELIQGIVIEKMSKSPLHRFIAGEIRRILESRVSLEFTVFHQDPMTTRDSEPEPDVMVVRGALADFRTVHPTTAELVVEVAVSSRALDRAKAEIYSDAGVNEYWIVCPDEKQVEIYRLPGATGYAEQLTITSPAVLQCGSLPGVSVDLAKLFG